MNTHCTQWDLQMIRKKFSTALPQIVHAANLSESVTLFKQRLVTLCPHDTVVRLCENDGLTIHDFSTEKEVHIKTIATLYAFLRNSIEFQSNPSEIKDNTAYTSASVDMLTDLYFIFLTACHGTSKKNVSEAKIAQWSKRWASGLNPAVQPIQEENKRRIIHKIVQRLERKLSSNPNYQLPATLNFNEKVSVVESWWNNYRFHLHFSIKSPEELNSYLDNTLSEETMRVLLEAKKKGIPFFITPYYLSLLDITGNSYDDVTLRAYILYSKELVDTFGEIKAWEREDKVEPGKGNAAGWLLPEGNNIHRRYPDVAIFIPDSGGRACGGLCASCQRMYDFQNQRLSFNLTELFPKESWPLKLRKLMAYFEDDTQLRDILITGGDALMSRNATLHHLFEAILKMALQKRKANEYRPDGEKFAEIQRIRLGTRLPVYLPMRMDDELIAILKQFREKALKIGISQFIIQTHFQTPLEMTKEACAAINRLTTAGWTVTNQLVFNVAASRRGHTTALRKTLINNGVIPYYTFSVKGFRENYVVYAPIARMMQERTEEKVYGTLDHDQINTFVAIVQNNAPYIREVNKFLQKNKQLFVATDRSVLNLPGIGKSMTFQLAGITPQGARILCFDHDTSRKHSPAIRKMDKIYITENKSILSYLRQLGQLGEDVRCYQSIWEYTEGTTESKCKLYEYPSFPFHSTEQINHIEK